MLSERFCIIQDWDSLLIAVVSRSGRGGPMPQKARDGQWDTRGKKALKPGRSVDRWLVIVFAVSSETISCS